MALEEDLKLFSVSLARCVLERFHLVVGRCFVCWYVVRVSYPVLVVYLSQSIVDAHTAHHLYHQCLEQTSHRQAICIALPENANCKYCEFNKPYVV